MKRTPPRGTFAFVLALTVVLSSAAGAAGLAVGTKAPDFTLKDLDGNTVKLSTVTPRQVTLLDFGRFTCEPCRLVMGELQKLWGRYGGPGLGVYALNVDGPTAKHSAPPAARELGLTFPVLLDLDLSVAQQYRVTSIPHLVVIDTKGVIRFVHEGYDPTLLDTLADLVVKYRPPLPRMLYIQDTSCPDCGLMPALLKEVALLLEGRAYVDIVPYSEAVVAKYQLQSAPAQLFFDRDGNEKDRHEGQLGKDDLLARFRKLGVKTD